MRATDMTRRERRGAMAREITYQRVLLAIYMLSDERGLACKAINSRIGLECGHGVEAVRRSLKMMEERDVIATLGQWDGLNRRIIVLLDHPQARGHIADVKAGVAERGREESERRVTSKRRRV